MNYWIAMPFTRIHEFAHCTPSGIEARPTSANTALRSPRRSSLRSDRLAARPPDARFHRDMAAGEKDAFGGRLGPTSTWITHSVASALTKVDEAVASLRWTDLVSNGIDRLVGPVDRAHHRRRLGGLPRGTGPESRVPRVGDILGGEPGSGFHAIVMMGTSGAARSPWPPRRVWEQRPLRGSRPTILRLTRGEMPRPWPRPHNNGAYIGIPIAVYVLNDASAVVFTLVSASVSSPRCFSSWPDRGRGLYRRVVARNPMVIAAVSFSAVGWPMPTPSTC